MKRVFASQDQAAIAIVRELLANEGIETTIQNENMSAVSGEVPFTLAMPEVCVVRDEDKAQALAIVAQLGAPLGKQPDENETSTIERERPISEGEC